MLKKVLSILIVGVMILSLTACGGKDTSDGSISNNSKVNNLKEINDDAFLDYYYVYTDEEGRIHLTSKEQPGITTLITTGTPLRTITNYSHAGLTYIIDDLLILDKGDEMFAGKYDEPTLINNLIHIENLIIKSAERMFACSKKLPSNIGKLNTKYITNMHEMFYRFKGNELNINNFDVGNVTTMNDMFSESEELEQINLNNWNTNNVENMEGMFSGCFNLKRINISNWNTSNLKNINNMFSYCAELEEINIEKWNASKLETADGTFEGTKLKKINLNKWITLNLKTTVCMFRVCEELVEVNMDKWDVSNIVNMDGMFDGCEKLSKKPSWYKE